MNVINCRSYTTDFWHITTIFSPNKNWIYEYRTFLTMKNKDTWKEGQNLAVKVPLYVEL